MEQKKHISWAAAAFKFADPTALFNREKEYVPLNKSFFNTLSSNPFSSEIFDEKSIDKAKKLLQDDNTSSSLNNHITAYKSLHGSPSSIFVNQNDKPRVNGKRKNAKQIFNDHVSAVQHCFEFPRQQKENQHTNPEVMQFKASQQLVNPNQSNANTNEQQQQGHHVAINQQQELLQTLLLQSPKDFRQEWKKLIQDDKDHPHTAIRFQMETKKPPKIATIRYDNITCNDKHRVILPHNRFIHANYIHGVGGRKLVVATQGPLKSTVYDFWSMIIQEKCPLVVMLCHCFEMKFDEEKNVNVSVEKSYCYFPSRKHPIRVQNLTIIAESVNVIHVGTKREKVVKREIKIIETNTQKLLHQLVHLQHLDWPDLGVPESTEALMYICKRFVLPSLKTRKPVTIHCSAGVGRTGVLIGSLLCLDLFLHNQLVSFPKAILLLRRQRSQSVQSFLQYTFLCTLFFQLVEYTTGQELAGLKEKYAKLLQRIKDSKN